MDIRRIKDTELDQALELVLRVFMEFEAPDYSAEGVEAFVNDVINNEGFKQGCMEGAIKMYGAFDGDKTIGVMAMRKVTPYHACVCRKRVPRAGCWERLVRIRY